MLLTNGHLPPRAQVLPVPSDTVQGSIRLSRTNPVPESHQPSNGALLRFPYHHRNLNRLPNTLWTTGKKNISKAQQ